MAGGEHHLVPVLHPEGAERAADIAGADDADADLARGILAKAGPAASAREAASVSAARRETVSKRIDQALHLLALAGIGQRVVGGAEVVLDVRRLGHSGIGQVTA